MRFFFFALITFYSIQFQAQSSIEFSEEAYLRADGQTYIICKAETVGEAGTDQIWDFSDLEEIEETTSYLFPLPDREMAAYFPQSNLIIQEERLMVFLKATPTMLYEYGYTSGERVVAYDEPIIRFPFPFEYGSSVQGRYSGKRYGSQVRPIQGEYHTEADGSGTLILPNNTVIGDVIRVKFTKTLDNNLTDRVTYRWYSTSYDPIMRYPLLTVFTTNTLGEVDVTRAAYYRDAGQFSIQDKPYREDDQTTPAEYTSADAGPYELKVTPNPFNELAMIEYTLPRKSKVKIQVFDQSGRLIETLVSGEINEGRHSVPLQNRGEFIYFIRFAVEDQILASRKVFGLSGK